MRRLLIFLAAVTTMLVSCAAPAPAGLSDEEVESVVAQGGAAIVSDETESFDSSGEVGTESIICSTQVLCEKNSFCCRNCTVCRWCEDSPGPSPLSTDYETNFCEIISLSCSGACLPGEGPL